MTFDSLHNKDLAQKITGTARHRLSPGSPRVGSLTFGSQREVFS